MFKRMISLLLAVAMVISMVPATGFAVETEPEETAQETTAPETFATEPAVTDVPTEEQTTVPTESEVPTVPTEPETQPATEPAETEPSESVPETEPEETVEETVAEEAAATLIVSGYCGKGGLKPGENLQYAFYSDGALYITGEGEMKDYASILDIPPWAKTWTNDYPQVTSVSLPEGLVNIGNCAFYGSAFTSVEIPSTVTKIGTHAFYSNGNLQKVTMPDGVVSIGEYAFDLCRSLVEINWPSSLVEIGNSAFHNCSLLKTVDIPNVTNLGEWVFAMCVEMEECYLSENLTYIPEYAFYGCDALKGIHIPDEVLGIGDSAFYGSGLEEITVPGSVLQLGDAVFQGCTALQSADLSGNLTELPFSLFYNCRSLEKVFLKTQPLNPDNPEERVIKTIGSQAFRGCTALKEFTLPETVTSIGNSAFYGCRSLPGINFLYNDELTIGDYAFHDCDSLNIVVIPNEVTSLGQNVFSYCDELERVSVGENIRNLPECLFQGCKKLIQADVSKELKSIGAGVFNGCESLTDIKLPDTLEEIGANAFKGCKSLSNVPLLSVKTFGNSAFEDCDSFTEVTLPLRTDYTMGNSIFRECDNLKTVKFEIVDPEYDGLQALDVIPSHMFYGCDSLDTINLIGTRTIGNYAFSGCNALKITKLPDTLREIGNYAFSNCAGFTEMTIPNGITQYGDHIFYHCGNLKKVNLPADMKVLPAYMFYWCDALEDIELHEGLVEIQNYAFSSCDSLKVLNFPDSLTTLGNNVYSCCEGLEIVSIPHTIVNFGSGIFSECMNLSAVHLVGGDRGITALPEKMLENCTALEEITLPNSLTSIGDGVFSGCKNLKEVEIYSNKLETIGSNAFYKCQSLTELTLPDSVHTIGAYAFSYCYNLQKFELPHNLTAISKGLFSGNRNMQYVIIPVAVKEIGDYAFNSCEAFTDVYYMGSGFEWQLITKSETGNVPLHNAEVHYNGVKDSGELEGGLEWKLDFYNTLTIFGKGDMPDYSGVGQAPWYEHREDIEKVTIRQGITRIGTYSFAGLDKLHTITIPASMKSIGANAFLGCAALKKIQYMGTSKEWYAMDIDPEGNEMLEAAALKCILLVDHTVENQQIRIHRSGNATAWYRTTPNVEIGYTLAGDTDMQPTGPATSGPEGVFTVPLGHFGTPGTYEVIVKVHSIGEESYDPAIEMVANIQVTDLEFFQSWELKMEAKGSAGISKGVGGEIGALEAKAELAAIKGTANVGSVMNVTRNYSGGKNSLKVTSDRNMGIGVEVGSGIYAEAGGAKLDIARANLGVSGSAVESYGIRIDDFNYSPDQLKALGIYFLGESLVANPCSTYYVPLYRYLTDKYAYDKLGCTVISGFGTKVVGSASAGLGQIKVNDNALFSGVTAVKGDFKATVSQMMKYSSTGEYEKTTSVQLTDSLAALTASGGIPSELKKNLLGKDIQVKATSSAGGKSLAIKSLVEREGAWDWNFSPKVEKTAEYISAVITDDSADGPMSQSPAFRHYLYDPSMFLSTLDMVQMAIAMAEWKLPTQYREETQHQTLSTIPDIAIGASLGLSGKLAVTLSYMEKNGYTTGYGYNGVVTGKSDEDTIEIEMRDKIFQIDKFIDECAIPALVEDASKLYNTVVGIIKITIEAGKALIKGIQDSIYNWAVSLTVPNSGFTGSYSCQVKAIQQTSQMTANGISSVAGYNFDTVATIGDTILVTVQDLDTGMDVTDLSAEPLTLVLRYDEADLEAAGLTKDSAVVLDGSIAIYRYSDEGDFFEFVGGENDLAAMTVTTQIVKPGQYVLAADSCAPQLSSLNLSDFREMPTITARIDDLSGLDVSKFVFKLDGAVKVDSSNVSQYLNSNTGLFTYAVTEALSEGEHSMSFALADTTGNTQTYEYSFRIDLTAPVITETSITGATNENAVVEVRAKISDENLEAVYAVFSKRNSDGTWSATASAEMAQLEDGTWALDYVGDGSTVKVYIQAMDIAGNTAQSDAVEVHPFIESVQIEAEYIVLRENQSHTLSAVTAPAEFASQVAWTTVDASIAVIDEYGVLTGKKEGTTYAIATVFDGNKRCSARVRVDVTEALDIEGVQLSTAKATTELYKSEYTTLDILLKLPQNYSAQANADRKPVNNGVAIESAKFTDETMAKYFSLAVLDDRTVQIVPTAEALANAKAVKGSYKGTVTVTVDGQDYVSEVLTLSVKKTLPKLKATVAAFNSFYAFQSHPIVITGATVTGIALDSSKAQPEWLTLKDGKLVLNEKAPAKSASGKVNLLVETAEWAVPTALTLTVKNTYKVPGVKLAATSVTVSNQPGPAAVELKLVPTNKADTISGIGISGITAPEGYTVENFNKETGTFTLKAAEGFKNGKIDLKVNFGNVTNTLKLTIKTQAVKLKLSASKVSLNKDQGDVASVTVNCLTAGYDVTAPVLTYDAEMLNVQHENGKLTISAKAAAVYGKTYAVSISAYEGAPAVKLNVAILKQNVAVKSTIKATGFIDVIRDGTAITVTPTYTNALNVDVDKAAVLKIYSSADKFKTAIAEVKAEGGIFTIDKSVISDQSLKYKAQLETVIGGNTIKSNLISLTVKMGTAKLTVKSEDTTLFSKDKNDWALVWFEPVDATLNDIVKVEFKNAKQAAMFELIDYGDGTYAIGFKDGKVDKSLIGKTVTVALNVFLEGNQTAKANAAVSVKLTVVK